MPIRSEDILQRAQERVERREGQQEGHDHQSDSGDQLVHEELLGDALGGADEGGSATRGDGAEGGNANADHHGDNHGLEQPAGRASWQRAAAAP